MIALSASLGRIRPSPTIAATQRAREMARAGRDVISLTAGEPDFDPPPHVAEAAARAVAEGRTRYTAPDGIAELKRAVAEKFRRDNGLDFEPAEIGVATGGKQVIWNALEATLDPGDEVVIFAPYWPSYPDMVRLAGGTPVVVPTEAGAGFLPRPEALAAAMGPRTRWVVLNSPNNPTGAVIPPERMAALARVVLAHPSALLMADDIYEPIRHGVPFATPAAVEPAARGRTLTVNGVSKAHAMTGWRIGYGAGPAALIAAMRTVQSQTTSCPCSVAQWAAVAALEGPQDAVEARRGAYERRRDLVLEALGRCPGLRCARPDGAFYVYPSIEGCIGRVSAGGAAIGDDEAFATALLEEEGVAVVHGAAFGASPALRMSTATSDEALHEAMRRLVRFCEGLR